ncbi:MAG: helix-turn-helix domain-containing protein [bacterium]
MALFKEKKVFLDQETVAEQLRQTRQKIGLSLYEISTKLKINVKYLDSIEKGRYDELPEGIYALNFLKEYASFLEINYKKLLKQFFKEKEIYQSEKQKELFAHQIVSKKYLLAIPNLVKYGLIIIIAIACLIYLTFLVKNIFVPPSLEVVNPPENFITEANHLVVIGKTDPETEVLINSEQIMVDALGHFEKEVNLKQGLNNIIITARKSSHQTVLERQVLLRNDQD